MTHFLFNIIIVVILFFYILESYIEYLNYTSWPSVLPDDLKEYYSPSKYVKAFFYNQEKYFLSTFINSINLIVLFLMIVMGGFNLVDSFARSITKNAILISVIFFITLFIANHILMIPFQIYNTFVIENKYGFNRTGISLFIKDNIISLILLSILIAAVVTTIIFLYEKAGKISWLYVWILLSVFFLFIQYYYTTIIVPLFNKLTLLEKGPLYIKIKDYAKKINFPVDKIFIMDASKRSSKANAYFSGFGKRKSIVLHDTLLLNHTDEEIIAVLAHEAGHYKMKHTLQMFVVSSISSGIMIYLLFQFVDTESLSSAVGIKIPGFHGSILSFGILFGPVSFLLGTIANVISRKNENEADKFAKSTSSGKSLVSALKKFSVEHLSNLKPHKLNVFFNYTHPPTIERIHRLEND